MRSLQLRQRISAVTQRQGHSSPPQPVGLERSGHDFHSSAPLFATAKRLSVLPDGSDQVCRRSEVSTDILPEVRNRLLLANATGSDRLPHSGLLHGTERIPRQEVRKGFHINAKIDDALVPMICSPKAASFTPAF